MSLPPSPSFRTRDRWRLGWHLGWLGAICFASAAASAAMLWPAFDAARHPLALLGSPQAPHAAAFNGFGFGLAGAMLAGFVLVLERGLMRRGAGRMARIGTGMLLIAAIAFALQGCFPLDPEDLDAGTSRLHAVLHAIARLAWMAAAAVLAAALRDDAYWRSAMWVGLGLSLPMWIDLLVPLHTLLPHSPARRATVEIGLFGLWWGWPALLAVHGLRSDRIGESP
jgi:hypothetical membrane protein